MSDDLGPPGGKERPGATPDARPNQKSVAATTNNASVNGPPRQCGDTVAVRRPADLFRDGFHCGARDALRLAQREIDDPHARAVLARLADDYELAGGEA